MSRILFIVLQAVILVVTLFVALDDHLFGSLSLTLVHTLSLGVSLWLSEIGFPLVSNGGGAVCPVTCHGGLLLTALSLLATGLSARELWRLWKSPTHLPPQAFGPLERLLAGAGLLLIALEGVLLVVGLLFPALGGVGSAMVDMFIHAVTLGLMPDATKLVHLLLALAFWIMELKQLRGMLWPGQVSRSAH